MPVDSPDDDAIVVFEALSRCDHGREAIMIEGLRLTMPGEDLRRLLEERIDEHRRCAARWKREQERTPEEQTEDEPLLPEEMCGNEAERHEWRAEVLAFIRERIESAEIYRLSEADLAFAELLPRKPWSVEQEEWEERRGVGFQLERLVKTVGDSHWRSIVERGHRGNESGIPGA